jgi:hypothetical protein
LQGVDVTIFPATMEIDYMRFFQKELKTVINTPV